MVSRLDANGDLYRRCVRITERGDNVYVFDFPPFGFTFFDSSTQRLQNDKERYEYDWTTAVTGSNENLLGNKG